METTVCFVSASRQNVFFAELLDAFAEALHAQGVATEQSIDCFPQLREGLVYVFVPHELLPLTLPEAHPRPAQLRRSVVLCTEQPGTPWFDEDARIAEQAAAAIDINRLGVHALKKLGVDARLLQLGYVPAWDHWGGTDDGQRTVDLTFQGGATPRRLQALARCASRLAGRPTELHLFESAIPHQADSAHFLSGARKWEMLRRSKLMLNIHRSELGYLEWQRVIGAITNGCVVLSEHSLGFEPLVPGEHLASVSYDALPVALEALLGDEQRIGRMRAAAYAFVREHPMSSSIEVLAEAASEVGARPVGRAELRVTPVLARPKAPVSPPFEFERILSSRTEVDVVRMALKQVLLDQRALRDELKRVRMGTSDEDLDRYAVEEFGPARPAPPKVSVLLSVYNYGPLVGAAIASVAASDYPDCELVIVDDASTDHSAAAIREALAAAPWQSARVLTRAHNRGLARARNLAAEAAAGELLFILDADNTIYPHALGHLAAALEAQPEAAFAYGIIEQVGPSGASGLMSYLGWDPVRLRYGNFIDAMAMIRRAPLLEAGGYTTDPRLYGWEDLALWCALAQNGSAGVRVPEFVAQYRIALHSMISLTNIDASAAWSTLLDRFPFLSAEQPLERA